MGTVAGNRLERPIRGWWDNESISNAMVCVCMCDVLHVRGCHCLAEASELINRAHNENEDSLSSRNCDSHVPGECVSWRGFKFTIILPISQRSLRTCSDWTMNRWDAMGWDKTGDRFMAGLIIEVVVGRDVWKLIIMTGFGGRFPKQCALNVS